LGDLLDEPLLIGGTHLAQQLKGVGGQLEVVAIDAASCMSCHATQATTLQREHNWLAIFGRRLLNVCVKFHAAWGRRARVA
jgi:hypothetical protein